MKHTVSERSLVPDDSLTIREGAIAAWPGAWQGKNLRDILATLGYDVDKPWKNLSAKDRNWILFTDEKPVVTVHAQREAHRIQRPYQGTYQSAANYVLHTFANTNSATLRKRALGFMDSELCFLCKGKRLKAESLAVQFAGHDIADLSHMHLEELADVLAKAPELKNEAAALIVGDILDRIKVIRELGLDYLSLSRTAPTLSAGELQRLRLMTQVRSGLFGVVYVLDEPSAGLHPADAQPLIKMLCQLKDAGNSVFVVEHDLDVVRQADWVVGLGPDAGDGGGELLFSGPVERLASCKQSLTARYLQRASRPKTRELRKPANWIRLSGIYRHNLNNVSVDLPLGVLTAVSGVSGSGKSTLVSQVLPKLFQAELKGSRILEVEDKDEDNEEEEAEDELEIVAPIKIEGLDAIKRLVCVDQKPIGRTPRSNIATYTGLFDQIRKAFANTPEAKACRFNASRFSFNVAGGRCATCEGEGFIAIELLFLPVVYSPCSSCNGSRYNEDTLKVTYNGLNIAQVLDLTVNAASEFFADLPNVARALKAVHDVGLGYLRLGQPATELSGGEAQRIKLATELQRTQVGNTLYLLDEPTTGLHSADTEKLMTLLHALVDAGNTVIVVEHDMDVVASADWVIDLGPGAGRSGGRVVATGPPAKISKSKTSRTAFYLSKHFRNEKK